MTTDFDQGSHAILIVAHENPAAILRLVRRLEHDRIHVFVHIDKKNWQNVNNPELAASDATIYSTRRVEWGGFSLVDVAIDLLQKAYDFEDILTFSLISGSDYPLMSVDRLVQELDSLKINRIDNWTEDNPDWHERYRRYFFHDNRLGRVLNGISRRLSNILPRRKAPKGMTVYFGWTWWTIRRDAAKCILDFKERREDVVRWYRHVHIPDESLIQTALHNSPDSPPMSRDTKRFIRFENASAHPEFIEMKDLDTALSGKYWFGRKFSEDLHPGVLDAIDMRLSEPLLR